MRRQSGLQERAESVVPGGRSSADDQTVAICPICERSFDERAYQLVIRDVGAFDSFACAEEALRRRARRDRGELAGDLLDAVRRPVVADDQAGRVRT